ncbi:unnamed protein product [Discosporangium mesarthrocarpum]
MMRFTSCLCWCLAVYELAAPAHALLTAGGRPTSKFATSGRSYSIADTRSSSSWTRAVHRSPRAAPSMLAFFPGDLTAATDNVLAIHHSPESIWAAAGAMPSLLLGDESGGGATYSKYSYYTTLGLYALSFPGLWSVIKRATKTKYKEATYVLPGPMAQEGGGKSLKQTAAEIVAYFQANNYKIMNAGEEITFEGVIEANKGQAFFLVFCTALSFATLALVLQIQFPAVGNYWFLLTLLSPYAGVYYWQNASRNDKAKVRLETSEDEDVTELFVTAAEEELDRLSKTMNFQEKGKIRIKGLLETEL